MFKRIYMDYAASAPLRMQARAKMVECFDVYGNPSSVHAEGQKARMMLDESRRLVADLLGVRAERIVFTSGATEANNLALRGLMAKAPGKRLLVSGVEHDCVRNTGLALGATEIEVDGCGVIRLDRLKEELARGDVALVSVMHANNENGVIQPLNDIAELAREAGAVFHTDAVQTVGHIPVDAEACDMMSFTAHKFGGPRGAGVLVLRPELEMDALVTGGAQERNRRAGTENVAAIAGMAAAMAAAFDQMRDERARARVIKTKLQEGMAALGLEIAGAKVAHVEHVMQVLTPGVRGEDVVIGMDMRGIAVSQGSACGSGKIKESHVLKAMGYDGGAAGEAIRISWGWASDEGDAGDTLLALQAVLKK